MRLLITSLLILSLHEFAYSQKNSKNIFGKPSDEELLMNYYEPDSSAEAVLLYDKEDVSFFVNNNHQYMIKTMYHGRLKVLKKSGLDRGIIKLKIAKRNALEEIIEQIKGATYNYENGSVIITPLTSASIFKENVNEYESVIKIVAPNFKEGSVFEYSYTRLTPFSVKHKPETWSFQGNIPFKWSEVSIVIPHRFHYKWFYNGYIPLFINEHIDTTINFGDREGEGAIKYHLVVKNAPAFVKEPYITSYKDCISKIDFELASYAYSENYTKRLSETWEDINKTLLEDGNFGEKLKGISFLNEIAVNFKSINDTLEKVKAAFDYVSKTIKWNGYFGIYTDESLNKAFDNKVGSGTQINMILVALLRSLNVEANPAIISTINNGAINEEFPLLNKFNFTIAQARVGGKDILMDATEKFSKPGMLPYHSLSEKAYIVQKNKGRLISYHPNEKKTKIENIDYVINPENNELTGQCATVYWGYTALATRKNIDEQGETKEIENLKNDNPDWQLENIRIENKDSSYQPLEIKYDFSSSTTIPKADVIYFNPLLSHRYTQNPFKETTRIYPVYIEVPLEEILLVTIKIPNGYQAENLPKSEKIVLPDKSGKFSYFIEYNNNVIKIKSQLSISKILFSSEEYPSLKELYNIMIDKQAQQITLKKL